MRDFFSQEGSHWFQERLDTALREVGRCDPRELRESPDTVVDGLSEKYAVQPVRLRWDEVSREEPQETSIEFREFGGSYHRPGLSIDFYVPFEGNEQLFLLRATQYSVGGRPMGRLHQRQLVFRTASTTAASEFFEAQVAQAQNLFDKHIDWINTDAARYNSTLRGQLEKKVEARKKELDAGAALSASLRVPLRSTRVDAQVSIPLNRKLVRPQDAPASTAQAQSEPSLDTVIYEDVVRTIRAVGNSFERLPETAARFDEEELRDLLLFILNSNYEGAVAGEVFNGAGKTDILLRYRDRNAFVGECKIWHGSKAFAEAVDQLLSYTVWRDTKAALIPFIKSKDAGSVIRKCGDSLRGHPNFVRTLTAKSPEARTDFLMRSGQDESRMIRLALLPVVLRPEQTV